MAVLQHALSGCLSLRSAVSWQALQATSAALPGLLQQQQLQQQPAVQGTPQLSQDLQLQQQQHYGQLHHNQQQQHLWQQQFPTAWVARSHTFCTSSSTARFSSSASSSSSSSHTAGHSRHRSHIPEMHGTTVLCVRKDNQIVLIADGQITAGPKVVKPNARKLRRLATEPQPSLGGFAGSTADGLTLFERLEQRLEEHPGQLRRAAVELAKAWRQDRVLRHLEAVMIIADATTCLEVSGKGELLEPADGVHAIGSGSRFAVAAARALMGTALPPLEIAQRAMAISAARCVYTNSNWVWEVITADGQLEGGSNQASSTSNSGNSSGSTA